MDEQQILAAPYRLTWQDRELKFGLLTIGFMASMTAACKTAAFLNHRENMAIEFGGDLDAEKKEEKARVDRQFREDMDLGLYAWGGSKAEKWRTQTHDGLLLLIKYSLEAGGTPVSDDELPVLFTAKAESIGAIIAGLEWDSTNPKAKKSAKLTAALAGLN